MAISERITDAIRSAAEKAADFVESRQERQSTNAQEEVEKLQAKREGAGLEEQKLIEKKYSLKRRQELLKMLRKLFD